LDPAVLLVPLILEPLEFLEFPEVPWRPQSLVIRLAQRVRSVQEDPPVLMVPTVLPVPEVQLLPEVLGLHLAQYPHRVQRVH